MPSTLHMIGAVFRRNFGAYFINPTGYVFITVFILLGAIAAFWQAGFFLNNLANLDQLNRFYPVLLLFFVPALTMNVWSDERRQGTDELLFTLPASPTAIVLGKYLAVLGIYTVAVLFSVSHVLILMRLGDPDPGLMVSTYLGYWLAGAALLAVGMVGSLLTANATVAFILGALLCALFVFADFAEAAAPGPIAEALRGIGIRTHFETFGEGLISLSAVVYFVALTAVGLYANVLLVRRRAVRGGAGAGAVTGHLVAGGAAGAVAGGALVVLAGRAGAFVDATAERLHTLQPQTRTLLEEVPADRPVIIQAFFSPDVPEALVRTRKNLANVLRRFDAVGGDRVRVVIRDVEPFSDVAVAAQETYDIRPRQIADLEGAQRSTARVYLGLVFTSGPEEFVIPFFDRGLPVEYELARSLRVVSRTDRKRLGVVATAAQLFGGFDFESMTRRPDWSIVEELRKQYDVVQVPAAGPYPEDLDVLLAVMPSSLTQPELDALQREILAGTPTLLLDDPLPMFDPNLAASLPKDAGRNPFQNQGQPPAPPKGDLDALLARLGLSWTPRSVVWSSFNPHPAIGDVAPEIVFICDAPDNPAPFDEQASASAELQEVVALYPGAVRADREVPGAALTRTALLRSGADSGETPFSQLVQNSFFGIQLRPDVARMRTPTGHTLAMQVEGTVPPARPDEEASEVRVIFVADVDMVSETFFALRRQGVEGFTFDNVTFALNCIDVLAGDESFVALRRHRPAHRTLATVEASSRAYEERRQEEIEAAEALAAEELRQAQQRLDARVEELRGRDDLDQQTKAIMLRNLERVENRRLDAIEAEIEQRRQRSIDQARTEMERAVAGIQREIKWWAALLPPVPPLLLALGLFARRWTRERTTIPESRLAGQAEVA